MFFFIYSFGLLPESLVTCLSVYLVVMLVEDEIIRKPKRWYVLYLNHYKVSNKNVHKLSAH